MGLGLVAGGFPLFLHTITINLRPITELLQIKNIVIVANLNIFQACSSHLFYMFLILLHIAVQDSNQLFLYFHVLLVLPQYHECIYQVHIEKLFT